MGAPQFVLRIIVATIAVITVGTIGVLGFNVVEPFYGAFGERPNHLAGRPAMLTVTFASIAFVGMLLFIVIWLVASPIRNDRRQGYR